MFKTGAKHNKQTNRRTARLNKTRGPTTTSELWTKAGKQKRLDQSAPQCRPQKSLNPPWTGFQKLKLRTVWRSDHSDRRAPRLLPQLINILVKFCFTSSATDVERVRLNLSSCGPRRPGWWWNIGSDRRDALRKLQPLIGQKDMKNRSWKNKYKRNNKLSLEPLIQQKIQPQKSIVAQICSVNT